MMSAFVRPALLMLAVLVFVGFGPAAPWHDAFSDYAVAGAAWSPTGVTKGEASIVKAHAPCPPGTHPNFYCEHVGYPPADPIPDVQRQPLVIGPRATVRLRSITSGPDPDPPRA